MELHPFLFWTFAALTALCALAVVVSQNIVRSATWLLFTLGGTSGIFFLLGADFVGATQLLVYVGGTLVLVVFGVMLTAQGPFITMKTSAPEWAISAAVGLLLLAVLSLVSVDFAPPHRPGLPKTTAKYAPKKSLSDKPASSAYSDTAARTQLGARAGPGLRPAFRRSTSARRAASTNRARPSAHTIICRSSSCRCICWWY